MYFLLWFGKLEQRSMCSNVKRYSKGTVGYSQGTVGVQWERRRRKGEKEEGEEGGGGGGGMRRRVHLQ